MFTNSSRLRSGETISSRPDSACIAATTSSVTANPSCDTNRAARMMRNGSSLNEASGEPGVRSTPARKSS
jgi:hypothetical protein